MLHIPKGKGVRGCGYALAARDEGAQARLDVLFRVDEKVQAHSGGRPWNLA